MTDKPNDLTVAKPTPVSGELIEKPPEPTSHVLDAIAHEIGRTAEIQEDNFGTDPLQRFELSSLAQDFDSEKLSKIEGQVIEPEYWMVHLAGVNTGDGKTVKPVPRLILITRDRKVYTTTSIVAFRAAWQMFKAYGHEPLPEGFKVRIKTKESAQGADMVTFVLER